MSTDTDLRAAAQAALEALENIDGIDTETECVTIDCGHEIGLLRAALAAPAAAPGWIVAAEQQAPAHTEVLVALSNGAVTTGELVGRLGWHWEPTDDEPEGVWVKHWMHKPAAPTS